MARAYHVSKTGNDRAAGTADAPFLTIQRAADLAMPGDTVIVHAGEYREWVDPKMGGLGDLARITYRAADGERVVIKGSERVTCWENVEGTVWKAVLPNAMFGPFNPYAEYLYGDWMVGPMYPTLHLGEVYLNGKSFYEAQSLQEVKEAKRRETGYNYIWASGHKEPILDPEDTVYQWCCQVDEENTTIWANFQGADPNRELTEINVRKCVFYPTQSGKDYITVSGFELAQAACPFTPPTGDQPGLIGPHWSKGWVIENNHIHDAKCSGVSLGKDEKTGDNLFTRTRKKPGYTYQFEAVGKAVQLGWSRDTIGSHIVRNNFIHDCGQNGIVGHMGCVWSVIEGNEICRIATKHEFFGWEIGAIKLHAPIDVQVIGNYLHHCTLGMWYDWETQGTRISRNLFLNNSRDLMVEVSHGPYLVDNNILGSPYSFENASQGGAYLHNLVLGNIKHWNVLNRSTPYHFPHSTAIMASSVIYGGDDRVYQNIFAGGADTYGEVTGDGHGSVPGGSITTGTVSYNGHPASWEEYVGLIEEAFPMDGVPGDENLYVLVKQPAYIARNVYTDGAQPYDRETDLTQTEGLKAVFMTEEDRDPAAAAVLPAADYVNCRPAVYLELDVPGAVLSQKACLMSTADLGSTRAAEEQFENPDGSPITFDTDYLGEKRTAGKLAAGPFAQLKAGHSRIRVW